MTYSWVVDNESFAFTIIAFLSEPEFLAWQEALLGMVSNKIKIFKSILRKNSFILILLDFGSYLELIVLSTAEYSQVIQIFDLFTSFYKTLSEILVETNFITKHLDVRFYLVKVCKKRIGLVLWWDIKTSNIEYYDIQYAAERL